MDIDYSFMNSDALKKTFIVSKGQGNKDLANKVLQILKDRGEKIPEGWKELK